MADETNNATPATESKQPKPKTVLEDMPSRVIKDTHEEAIAYITNAFETYTDFGQYEVISPIDASRKDPETGEVVGATGLGQDADGKLVFDPEIFPADQRVMIAVLTQRGDGEQKSKVKAIVVSPAPTLDQIIADEQGKKWLDKIVGTELNRLAVRPLRPEDANISDQTVLDSLPKSLADYVSSTRGSSTLLEAFEAHWKAVKAALSKLSKPWKLQNLSKRELKFAMSSAAYASQWYPTLEGNKSGSLFVFALKAFEMEAKKAGQDASIFAQWLATRDSHVISQEEEEEADEISLDALTAAMAAPATPEGEASADPDAATGENQDGTEAEQTGEAEDGTETASA